MIKKSRLIGYDNSMKKTLILLSLFLFSCASQPEEIEVTYIPSGTFINLNCQQIDVAIRQKTSRLQVLYQKLSEKRKSDQTKASVGAILFFPALFLLEGDDSPEAREYSSLRGELEALKDVKFMKCNTNKNTVNADSSNVSEGTAAKTLTNEEIKAAKKRNIEIMKEDCAELGFDGGTEGMGNCVLKLMELEKENSPQVVTTTNQTSNNAEMLEIERAKLQAEQERLEVEKQRAWIERQEQLNRIGTQSIDQGWCLMNGGGYGC